MIFFPLSTISRWTLPMLLLIPRLNERLKALSPQYENDGNYLFYLATPPLLYELIPKYLHDAGILKEAGAEAHYC